MGHFAIREVRTFLGIHREFVASLAFFPDGQRVFSSGQEWSDEEDDVVGKAEIWDLSGVRYASYQNLDAVSSGSLSPDGQWSAMATFEDLTIHETSSLQVRHRHKPGGRRASEVHFSVDGRWLAAAGNSIGDDLDTVPLVLYDRNSWEEHLLTADTPPVRVIASSPPGRLAFGCYGRTVQVWDADRRMLYREWSIMEARDETTRGKVTAVAFAARGTLVVAAGEPSSSLAVWDPLTGQCVWQLGHDPEVNALCPLDDNLVLAGDSEGVITLWDVRTGERLADAVTGKGLKFDISLYTDERTTTPVEQSPVSYLAVSPDRRFLLAGDWTGAIHLYEIHGLA